MCDACDDLLVRWKGWIDVPKSEVRGHGPWVDLSQMLSHQMGGAPSEMEPLLIEKTHGIPERVFNSTRITTGVHRGTHVDAPRHLVVDGPTFDQIPFDRLHGGGVVWKVGGESGHVVEVEELERMTPKMQPGDIVMLYSGWGDRIDQPNYIHEHTSISLAAADWLVKHGCKLLAVDARTPDAPRMKRTPGWRWPVHHVLLGAGMLIAENVIHMGPLAGHRVEACFLGINIEGSDGAPARVIARQAD